MPSLICFLALLIILASPQMTYTDSTYTINLFSQTSYTPPSDAGSYFYPNDYFQRFV